MGRTRSLHRCHAISLRSCTTARLECAATLCMLNISSEHIQEVEIVPARTKARQTTRRAVLHAAAQLFEERGFLATTVRDITQQAGVSVGIVMAAGDKEALLVELFDGLIEERQKLADTQVLGVNVRCDADALAVVEPFVVLFEERRALP